MQVNTVWLPALSRYTRLDPAEVRKETGRRLRTADLGELIAEVHRAAPGLFARRAAYLAEHEGGTVQWMGPGD